MAKGNDKLNRIKTYYDGERGDRERYLWDYYVGRDVPVFKRQPVSGAKAKSHTNTHEDFMKNIIDLKVGYMGQKIELAYVGDNETVTDLFKRFIYENNLSILNSDTVRKSGISGISHKLMYTEKGDEPGTGMLRVKNISAEDGTVVYEYETSILAPSKAYYYYSQVDLEGVITYHCDMYTSTNVTYYKSSSKATDVADGFGGKSLNSIQNDGVTYVRKGGQRHNLNMVPIVPFLNNDTATGDCDKVIGRKEDSLNDGLMDVYDELLSDTSAEVKAMRLAYLVMAGKFSTGKDADGNSIDFARWLEQTGVIQLPVDEDGNALGSVEFLEKNLNDQIIENMLNRLRTGIYEKSGSIDLKTFSSGSNQRVISVKSQLMPLENNCATTESYMKAGLSSMINIFIDYLKSYYSIDVDYFDFRFDFTRVFPQDIESKVTAFSALSATLDIKDALRLAGFEDVEGIAERALGVVEDDE